MGNGMKRAALATISTREWKVAGQTLTGAEVVEVYRAFTSGKPYREAKIDALRACGQTMHGMSGRRIDRCLQILKKSSLIVYDKSTREWRGV